MILLAFLRRMMSRILNL
ncbi:hypothetical protein RDABS01_015254 [Bienertia sinuspersici]